MCVRGLGSRGDGLLCLFAALATGGGTVGRGCWSLPLLQALRHTPKCRHCRSTALPFFILQCHAVGQCGQPWIRGYCNLSCGRCPKQRPGADNVVWMDPGNPGQCIQQSFSLLPPEFFTWGWKFYSEGYHSECAEDLGKAGAVCKQEAAGKAG